jgi:hypothetical protein
LKALPVKIAESHGYQPCPIEECTHVTLNIPGADDQVVLNLETALLSKTARPLQQEGGKEQSMPEVARLLLALDNIKNVLQLGTVSIDKIHELGADGPAEEAWLIFYDEVLPLMRPLAVKCCPQQAPNWTPRSDEILAAIADEISQPPGKLQQASIAQAETAKVASDKVTTCLAAECTAEVVRDKAACWCATCRPVTPFGDPADNRMVLCPTCGNKRCPHAHDHRNACTNSNELGQIGSHYPAASATDAEHVGSGALKQFLKAAEDAGITHLNFKRATPEGGQDERANWTTKQWYEHVGAWETAEGFISFGSVMALRAMLLQFQKMTIAQFAATTAAEPVLWVESEPGVRHLPISEIINSVCCTVMYHHKKPVTDNPVWPLYACAAPPQQGMTAIAEMKRSVAGGALYLQTLIPPHMIPEGTKLYRVDGDTGELPG